MQFVDLKSQYQLYRSDIDRRIQAVLDHGQFIMGPEIAELEGALASYVGVTHCITAASGTDSLGIALRALDIGPGHEVITVPFTWISTAEVIGLVGAKPVFVDIDPASFNIDIDLIEPAITPRTKAILPVSLFGQMPDYDRISQIAARHSLAVIEDGAQSLGATQRGRRSCGVTLIGSTSFFPAKPLGCYGDGGALFTNDDALAERMRAIRTHGGLKRHHHPYLGMNGRFDTLQAAVLLAKLPHFQAEVEARNRIGARYTTSLSSDPSPLALCSPPSALRPPFSDSPTASPPTDAPTHRRTALCPPSVAPGNTHVYAQYTIRVPNRDTVAAQLKERGIPTAVYYPRCLHEQPVFANSGSKWGDFPQAERASREVLSLPMHPFLSEADQDRVIESMRQAAIDGHSKEPGPKS
ncbi:MAG: DegT/DnrJ/EryC1/StrS family aminotransferase [Verrucomicrobia bacterium]|nr:DegT/DnrJ/EryC1/StrS family aminotransferase [Verrucomicrobiota bacterium]